MEKALDINDGFSALDQFQASRARDRALWFRGLDVTCATRAGHRVLFATDKKRDPIQRANRHGLFYEEEELELLSGVVPAGATFVDIGANVGNHTLYAAMFLGARRVIPVEPNPLAYRLLMANVVLNGLEACVTLDWLGVGLSDRDGDGFGMTDREKNLGAARMVAGAGDIPVTTGDALLVDQTPEFIKIDVEGMEMRVLAGLARTIARARPKLLVEVDRENDAAFQSWCEATGYVSRDTIQRYARNKNYLIEPASLP